MLHPLLRYIASDTFLLHYANLLRPLYHSLKCTLEIFPQLSTPLLTSSSASLISWIFWRLYCRCLFLPLLFIIIHILLSIFLLTLRWIRLRWMIGIIQIIKGRHHHVDQLSLYLVLFWSCLENMRAESIKIYLNIRILTVL